MRPRFPDLHCERHQAPAHYYYVQQGNRCVLRKRNNFPRFGSAGEHVTTKMATGSTTVQSVPCINGQPVVLPAGAWQCSNVSPTDPPVYPPVITPASPPIHCGRHQAPAGYYYKLVAGKCMLWRKNPNAPVRLSQAGTSFIYNNPTSNLPATATNTVHGLTNWVTSHKGLALALAVGGYYLFTKK